MFCWFVLIDREGNEKQEIVDLRWNQMRADSAKSFLPEPGATGGLATNHVLTYVKLWDHMHVYMKVFGEDHLLYF